MRRLAPLLLFLLPALAQKLVLGLALEGQALPIGLAGFARLEQGGYLLEARAGWELLGGVFVGLEGGVYLNGGYALQGGFSSTLTTRRSSAPMPFPPPWASPTAPGTPTFPSGAGWPSPWTLPSGRGWTWTL